MKNKLILVGTAIISCLIPFAAFAGDETTPGDVITQWNEQALDTVRTERLGAAPASRVYAMVNVAIYDAVNGIDRAKGKSDRDHALVPPDGAPAGGNREAAAAAAAHAVLSELYPGQSATYDAQLDADIDALGNANGNIDQGLGWGASVGDQVVALRANDGSSPSEVLPGGTGPGELRADFTSAQFRNMTPFAIADKAPYRSPGPPALTSPEYLSAHHEVRLLGDDFYFNPEYEELFLFWKGGGGTARPPGEWVKITIVVAEQEGTTESLSETARVFALLGMALADGTITAWDSKYTFHFWRPTTSIQNAGTDGNPDTVEVPNWTPRNGSIGGSPEHTSGQSTFAGVGSTILAGFHCNDNIEFTFEGDNAIAGPLTYASFSDAARDAGRARIFAGIHFEFSNQTGQAAGRGVAREILATALKGDDDDHNSCPSNSEDDD